MKPETPSAEYVITLSSRERQTVLAALETWQNELGLHSTSELQKHHPVLAALPLELAEVRSLHGRIQRAARKESAR